MHAVLQAFLCNPSFADSDARMTADVEALSTELSATYAGVLRVCAPASCASAALLFLKLYEYWRFLFYI
jgi:hypothetical protein